MPASAFAAMATQQVVILSEYKKSVFHIEMNTLLQFIRLWKRQVLRVQYFNIYLFETLRA